MDIKSSTQRHPSVAIVGSGPSGCFTAQFLRKAWPEAEITVFEALPVPYGLVRYGIAADHQGSKAVTGQFDRIFERMGVTFAGNVRIGADLSFRSVADAFDIVVLATGLADDRTLPVPRSDKARVVGAGSILTALNGHPSAPVLGSGPLGEDVVVIGHGNVAMDVARLLSKHESDLTGSDIDDEALTALRPRPVRSVHLVGRSPLAQAKFDIAMLRELGGVDGVTVRAIGLEPGASGAAAELFAELAAVPVEDSRTLVTFHFQADPEQVTHSEGRTVLVYRNRATGQTAELHSDAIITAIGFCNSDTSRRAVPDDSWDDAHVYRVGWLGRGSVGTVAANRKHAQQAAAEIVAAWQARTLHQARPGRCAVWPRIESRVVTYADWKLIDEAEVAGAKPTRTRRKITDVENMLQVLRQDTTAIA